MFESFDDLVVLVKSAGVQVRETETGVERHLEFADAEGRVFVAYSVRPNKFDLLFPTGGISCSPGDLRSLQLQLMGQDQRIWDVMSEADPSSKWLVPRPEDASALGGLEQAEARYIQASQAARAAKVALDRIRGGSKHSLPFMGEE